MGPRTPRWLNSTKPQKCVCVRLCARTSVYAGEPGQCENMQTVSTRGKEDDGIQTHTQRLSSLPPDGRGVDPIDWIPLTGPPMLPRSNPRQWRCGALALLKASAAAETAEGRR